MPKFIIYQFLKESQLFTLENKLEGSRQQLELIGNIRNIGFNLLDVIDPLIPLIEGALASSSGPVASGTIISNLTLFKKDFKDIIKKTQGSLSSIDGIVVFFNEEINNLSNPLNQGIDALEIGIQQLKDLREKFLVNFENFLEQTLTEDDLDNLGLDRSNISGYYERQPSGGDGEKEDPTSTVLANTYGTGEGNEDSTSLVYKGFKR